MSGERWELVINRGYAIQEVSEADDRPTPVASDLRYPDAQFIVWAHRWTHPFWRTWQRLLGRTGI